MTAESIATALGGRRAGKGWMARCPAHDDRTPSLSLRDADDGTVLVHCFAGCGQNEVITALRSQGLWPGQRVGAVAGIDTKRLTDHTARGRTEAALQIWQASMPAAGTLVEVYLKARGITMPAPAPLRFHPRLGHPSGGVWPAMVALVIRGNEPSAIHRTFLARDGKGKVPVEPQKMMLGPCRGGSVRLAEVGSPLLVGEGIETCLSAMQATGYPAWAALSTSGLQALVLPRCVSEVIILADGDAPGEVAASDCALRLKREGHRVRIARPPWGSDFNNLLMGS